MALECNRNDVLECHVCSMKNIYDLRWVRLTIVKHDYQLRFILEMIKRQKMYVELLYLVCLKPKRMLIFKYNQYDLSLVGMIKYS